MVFCSITVYARHVTQREDQRTRLMDEQCVSYYEHYAVKGILAKTIHNTSEVT
jgi:hypothetical protein